MNTNHIFFSQWIKLAFLCFIVCSLNACMTLPDPPNADKYSDEQLKDFKDKIAEVAKIAQEDPKYNRIPLDTEKDTKSFLEIALEYWAGDIDRNTFISEGDKRFPGHDYEFNIVADHLR